VVILKTLVILVIAGGIFGYYLYELVRKDFARRSAASLVAMILVIIAALASVIGGFMIIDSPARAHALKFDTQRVDNLSSLSSMIYAYYSDNKKLPSDLSASPFNNFHDPETNQSYEYRAVSNDQYELCATFSLAADNSNQNYYMQVGGDNWYYHGAGRQCFTKSVQITKPVEVVPAIR